MNQNSTKYIKSLELSLCVAYVYIDELHKQITKSWWYGTPNKKRTQVGLKDLKKVFKELTLLV